MKTPLFLLLPILFFVINVSAYTSRVWMTTDAISTDGLEAYHKTDISDSSRLKMIDGHKPESVGIYSVRNSILTKARLPEPISDEGTVALWIRPGKDYQTGIDTPTNTLKILEIENLCSFEFEQSPSTLDFVWRWDKSEGNTQYHDQHMLTPKLYGGDWIQIVFRWSAEENIFSSYINGIPYKQNQELMSLNNPVGERLILHVSDFAFSEMMISDRLFEGRELERLLDVDENRLLRQTLGQERTQKIYYDDIQGDLLYSNPLREPKDIRGWHPEGEARISFDNGLILESADPEGERTHGNIVLWCGEDMPASFIAKWKFEPLSEHALAMVFFAARGKNGKNIYDSSIAARDGTFSQYVYGDINSYHINYYTNTPYSARTNCSLWKNAGFYLADYGPAVVDPDVSDTYTATLIKYGNYISMAINSWIVISFIDDGERFGDVLTWGKIGFRQMKWTKMRYSDLEVYGVKVKNNEEVDLKEKSQQEDEQSAQNEEQED